jgi:hypothetical protein
MKNLCESCINRCGTVFNAKWYPSTGEVTTDPKYICRITHRAKEKNKCKNYESEVSE